jgi:Glycosyltransferase family 87
LNRPARAQLYICVVLDASFALGWAGFARWVVPPLLVAEHPGRLIQALKQYLKPTPVLFLNQDLLGRWREFSQAVLIAVALHLTIVMMLSRSDRRAAGEGLARDDRAAGRTSLALSLLAAAFLALTVLSGTFQDYYFYLEMWYHVRHGEDPWFLVFGEDGGAPLNAYGPLFNPLACLAWINPLAPKLLFAFAYLLFATSAIKRFTAGHPPSGPRALGLTALFWNPFPWVEVAYYGHFDVLVGLACLGALRAWDWGRDIGAGLCLAAGVLLKYLPIVLLPFLAFDPDRGRIRPRFLAAALLSIVAGLALSAWIWGPSTFLPLKLAASRDARTLSIFRFFRGPYSPLPWFGLAPNLNNLSPLSQLLGLAWAWSWWRARKPDVEATAVVAVTITVLLYRVGYPQYQMVPFVLTAAWAVRHRDRLRNRTALAVAMAAYFGWLAAFDVYYVLVEQYRMDLAWGYVREVAGLPTFFLGCAFLAAAVRAATPQVPVVATGPRSCSDV